jgi:hypothetical protein
MTRLCELLSECSRVPSYVNPAAAPTVLSLTRWALMHCPVVHNVTNMLTSLFGRPCLEQAFHLLRSPMTWLDPTVSVRMGSLLCLGKLVAELPGM